MKAHKFVEARLGEYRKIENSLNGEWVIKVEDLREFVESICWAEDSTEVHVYQGVYVNGALVFKLDKNNLYK